MRHILLIGAVLLAGACLMARSHTWPPEPSRSYWIWAGRTTASVPALRPDTTLYLHQGTFPRQTAAKPSQLNFASTFTRQGLAPYPIGENPLYLAIRVEELPTPGSLVAVYRHLADEWRKHGARVVGLQLDFDSPTRKLERYAEFIERVRSELGAGEKVSITGLADWASSASPELVARLRSAVDEIVFQLYEGRRPIPVASQYVSALSRTGAPFLVGVLPGQEPAVREALRSNPYFLGSVVFLLE